MDAWLRDIGYSLRRLRKAPVFTAIVIVTLALGIGANTAIFTVVNAVLLRPLPYRSPEQLVTIEHFYPDLNGMEAPVSARGFRDYRDKTHSFGAVAVETGFGANLTGTGSPERVPGVRVSGDWFQVLGVAPALGRALTRDDDVPGREHVVVLSHGLWLRLFAGRNVLGQQIELNDEPYQIVGVMPDGFHSYFSRNAEFFVPLALDAAAFARGYTNEYLNATARLRGGVSVDRAQAEMTTFASNLKRANPNNFSPRWTIKVRSLDDLATAKIRPALLVLLGAVGFVLLIACANVANLLLARAAIRVKEIAIRAALGADRGALVRQLLTESVLLSLTGGVLGLVLAESSVKSLVALNPNLPRAAEIHVDGRVMIFTLVVSVITGLLFGLAPSLQASRANLQETLRDGTRGGAAELAGRGVRRALVVAEVALALTLLTGAGLLIRSVVRLENVNPGFDPHHVLVFNLNLPNVKYGNDTARVQFLQELLPKLSAAPGVQAAGVTSVIPFGGGWSTSSFEIEGLTVPPGQNGPWGDIRIVSPGFFSALRIPLVRGRLFDQQDTPASQPVAVIDEQFVKKYFPNTDPIGKRITFGPARGKTDSTWITIVGVVGHAAHEGLDAEPRIQYYFPATQAPLRAMTVALRTAGDPASVLSSARQAVQSVDRELPLAGVNTLDQLVENSVGQRRLSMILLVAFSIIAIVLASIGIYGVTSYSVTQRTRELGIRMALGAARSRVLALVIGQGMALAALGVAIGLLAAFALTRLLASQLFGVGATDPATFLSTAGALVLVAFAATVVPALRATRVDPVVALRDE
ncbi:MAG TPA: ABC transporter permease [Gemmatimonadaceae bacterium]|nr:ABC transporter permease [Gemmatimonadaceae bacterium]